jgi:hypothetical protein
MNAVTWSALGAVLVVGLATSIWLARSSMEDALQPRRAARAANIAAKLRLRALNLTPEETGIAVPRTGAEVWGAVIDLGSLHGATTAVALADGSATLHWGTGDPVVVEQGPAEVQRAARAAVAATEACRVQLRARGIQQLPRPGHIRLYGLSRAGLLSSDEIAAAELTKRDDPLARCFQEIDRLVDALRSATPAA